MRLKGIIRKNGIKQSWVARKLGISSGYLSMLLNSKRRMTKELEHSFDVVIETIKGENR